ncbi:hypothetical protein VKT23_001611 [Stygiomarasmius scandens]|uniref:F-box domain-containing protein n=1 Tax=Marasmiellus scandens TaxID=2682957 RepID=A0ABR1JZE7_9AGAR
MSSTHAFPLELLREILKFHSSHSEYNLETSVIWKEVDGLKTEAPHALVTAPSLALSQVCSRWRKLALETPQLWSNLSLDLACNSFGIRKLVGLFLKRAGRLTLKVGLEYRAISWDDRLDQERMFQVTLEELQALRKYDYNQLPQSSWELLRSLLSENHRWYDVTFDLHRFLFSAVVKSKKVTILRLLNAKGDDALGTLEKLALSWDEIGDMESREPENEPKSSLFFDWLAWGAPKLHTLCLTQLRPSLFTIPFMLLHQLRSLSVVCNTFGHKSLGKTTLSDVIDILERCPLLESAEFDLDADTTNVSLQTITHHALRSLTCKIRKRDVTSSFLQSLTLPSLEAMAFSDTEFWSNKQLQDAEQHRFLESLHDLLRRLPTSLERLSFSGLIFGSDEELIQTLSLTPTVKHLVLDCPARRSHLWTDQLLSRLGASLLPCLQSIDITLFCDERSRAEALMYPDDNALYSMLLSLASSSKGRFRFKFVGNVLRYIHDPDVERQQMSNYVARLKSQLYDGQIENLDWVVETDFKNSFEDDEQSPEGNEHFVLPMYEESSGNDDEIDI